MSLAMAVEQVSVTRGYVCFDAIRTDYTNVGPYGFPTHIRRLGTGFRKTPGVVDTSVSAC